MIELTKESMIELTKESMIGFHKCCSVICFTYLHYEKMCLYFVLK